MVGRPLIQQVIVLGALGLSACTLGDDYRPTVVGAAPAPVDAGGMGGMPSEPPPPSTAGRDAGCSAGELQGCVVEIDPPDPDPPPTDAPDAATPPDAALAGTCDDGLQNQGESDEDCAGPCAQRCALGDSCTASADCAAGLFCAGGGLAECAPIPLRCDDGILNGTEPVVDCGNAECGLCDLGSACGANAHCDSGSCRGGFCLLPLCEDNQQSGTETDTDCGGSDPACARCAVSDNCAINSDCQSGSCLGGRCADCDDNDQNGNETGVDCGGSCGDCDPGEGCSGDADCLSGACEDGRCCGGTLVDCTRCALRLSGALNCNTNGPAAAPTCEAFLQCLADNPVACPTRHAENCSVDPGGVCNHTAFGGNGGPGVGLADAILGSAQCFF